MGFRRLADLSRESLRQFARERIEPYHERGIRGRGKSRLQVGQALL